MTREQRLEEALRKAEEWLTGWASAEPYLSVIRDALALPLDDGWRPIVDAPTTGREMFIVRAFNVCNGFTGGKPYTSDAWAVWRASDGSFARWPHHFAPTHFHALPSPPKDTP